MADEESKFRRSRAKEITLKFIECINSGDCKGLMDLQTDDFMFIDLSGNRHIGKDSWENYFTSYPDYKIHVDKLLTSGSGVAVYGRTTGSHAGPEIDETWKILWTAGIRDDQIAEWRIYTDFYDIKGT
ncbi:MAG: nuclear transport factor 2 family protein [Candidatus Thorarchaeota archaeon]